MNSKFRVGILGCGKIARRHVEACLLCRDAELSALIDPNRGNAEALAKEFGLDCPIGSRLGDLQHSLDGAVIAAPNNFHCELAQQCADAGIHVLIEKPISGSTEESVRICEAHERSGTVCSVGFVTRFRPNNRQMKRLIDEGYFGTIEEFAYQFGSRGGWAPLSAYNLDKEATGGGVLVVTGSHFLDRMLHWFGYPNASALWTDSLGGPEANALASFRFERDGHEIVGTARFSKTVRLTAGFVMRTSRGIVQLDDAPDARILFRPSDADLRLGIEPELESGNIFVAQLSDFIDACRSGRAPTVDGRQALESVRLTESLYESMRPLSEVPASGTLETEKVSNE